MGYFDFRTSPMAKKTCWFGWFKRLFVSQEKTRTEKVVPFLLPCSALSFKRNISCFFFENRNLEGGDGFLES